MHTLSRRCRGVLRQALSSCDGDGRGVGLRTELLLRGSRASNKNVDIRRLDKGAVKMYNQTIFNMRTVLRTFSSDRKGSTSGEESFKSSASGNPFGGSAHGNADDVPPNPFSDPNAPPKPPGNRRLRVRRPGRALMALLIFLAESLTIWTLYINNRDDDWIKFLSFVPLLNWIPACEVADISKLWTIAPVVGTLVERMAWIRMLRTQSGASMIFVNAIWVALLVTNLYRNYNIAQHWNTEPVVLAWGTTLTLLKPITLPVLSIMSEEYRPPASVYIDQAMEKIARADPKAPSLPLVLPSEYSTPEASTLEFLREAKAKVQMLASTNLPIEKNIILSAAVNMVQAKRAVFGYSSPPPEEETKPSAKDTVTAAPK